MDYDGLTNSRGRPNIRHLRSKIDDRASRQKLIQDRCAAIGYMIERPPTSPRESGAPEAGVPIGQVVTCLGAHRDLRRPLPRTAFPPDGQLRALSSPCS